jgi:hypothetical protein
VGQVTEASTTVNGAFDGHEVTLLRGDSAERTRVEDALRDAGRPLPLPQRAAWATLQPASHESWLLVARDRAGTVVGAAGVQVAPSRALPGHLLLRCERFGPGLAAGTRRLLLRALVALARTQRRALRLNVETFTVDDAARADVEAVMREEGLVRLPEPRSYEHTLLVPLMGDEEAIFAGFHATARRHVRAAGKNPVRVGSVDDPAYFGRLDAISRETYARTGGTYDPADWAAIVALCQRDPSASRLTGIFRTDVAGPDALLAFAWGCGHGDHAHYSRAGSTRDTDLKMPLMYPVVWDLIRWARQHGARHFDFGGVTMGNHDSEDRLGGISDFKRYFSGIVVPVGAEWVLEPRPVQARAARVVSATSTLVARVLARS